MPEALNPDIYDEFIYHDNEKINLQLLIKCNVHKCFSVGKNIKADFSSFVCVILSHGTKENKIITHDNKHMALKDIIQTTDIPELRGKPKIFIIQVFCMVHKRF